MKKLGLVFCLLVSFLSAHGKKPYGIQIECFFNDKILINIIMAVDRGIQEEPVVYVELDRDSGKFVVLNNGKLEYLDDEVYNNAFRFTNKDYIYIVKSFRGESKPSLLTILKGKKS